MRLKKYNSKKTSAFGGNFVPHLSVAPLAAYAERGRVNPPSLHCVAPLSLPPPPLRGSPGFEAGCVCAWAHPQVCDCRCAAPAQTQGSREAAGAKRDCIPSLAGDLPCPPPTSSGRACGPLAWCPASVAACRNGLRPPWPGAPRWTALTGGACRPPPGGGAPRCTSRCIQYRTPFLPEIILIPVVYLYFKT